ncbi:hypothetical protein [Falsibacillus pallidus]|uniref:ABC-2 type transport system permease protein n=1 Tax=Falsibacillus pallidus TaxID=493781 RepID=A0A370GK76_9BACI|nr:hypothetical protein [Falsibacillus pallidus]RDI44105.1 hypothetical protein DFR59_103169 [Falsibacillus pallidus]
MNAFRGLLKKDYLLSKSWMLTWFITMFILLLLSYGLSSYLHEPFVLLGIVIFLGSMHIAFIPVMMLSFLRTEGRTQLWLHSPQPSKMLIFSKVLISVVYQLISQLVLTIVFFILYEWLLPRTAMNELGMGLPYKEGFLINLTVFCVAFYLSCWCLFYWTVYHSLSKFPSVKRFRWLILILLFVIWNTIETLIMTIKPLAALMKKWSISIYAEGSFHYEQGSWNAEMTPIDVPLLPIVLYALLTVLLFFASSWLLEKKVEV